MPPLDGSGNGLPKKNTSSLDGIWRLVPFAMLAVAALAIAFRWWPGKESGSASGDANETPTLTRGVALSGPDPPDREWDLLLQQVRSSDQADPVGRNFQARATDLAKSIEKLFEKGIEQAENEPEWISPSFRGEGVDDQQRSAKPLDQQWGVDRWSASDSPLEFNSERAFIRFAENAIGLPATVADVRVELNVYDATRSGDELTVRLLVEAYGWSQESATRVAETGIRQVVRQTTGLWSTQWTVNSLESGLSDYVLDGASVIARESVQSRLNSNHLFADCSQSVFGPSGRFNAQLRFGVDQWSQVLPGIDLQGRHGLAIGDVNGDGLEDIYVCQPRGLANLMLVQNPDGTVMDVSRSSGTDLFNDSSTAVLLDLDNDGDQDLVVGAEEALFLLDNNGTGSFELMASLPSGSRAQGIAAADFDLDGDLDLFICRHAKDSQATDLILLPTELDNLPDGSRNVLLRNEGRFQFVDVTESSNLATAPNDRCSWSCCWYDFDHDGDSDLFVANEFSANQLFRNDQGQFLEVGGQLGLEVAGRHTSVSIGEFNNDGIEDLFVATSVPLEGYRTLDGVAGGNANFQATELSGLHRVLLGESLVHFNVAGQALQPYRLRAPMYNCRSAFGSVATDLNNDGLDDLVITNGRVSRMKSHDLSRWTYESLLANSDDFNFDGQSEQIAQLCRAGYSLEGHQRNRCLINLGASGFANASAISGLDLPDDGRAVATVDWDQDGDMDLLMTCRTGPQLRFFNNQLDTLQSSVTFRLQGTTSNRDAVGARVELFLRGDDLPLVRTVRVGSGSLAQSSKRLVFGIPQGGFPERARVTWPSGLVQDFNEVVAGASYLVIEGTDEPIGELVDRVALAIRPTRITAGVKLPVFGGPSFMSTAQPMPPLQAQLEDGRWYDLASETEQCQLLLFVDDQAGSKQWVQSWDEQHDQWLANRIETAAIWVGDHNLDSENQNLQTADAKRDWRIRGTVGRLSPGSRGKLRRAVSAWFNQSELPQLPFALLVNQNQDVCAFYNRLPMEVDRVLADLELDSQPGRQYRQPPDTSLGRWLSVTQSTPSRDSRLQSVPAGYSSSSEEPISDSQGQVDGQGSSISDQIEGRRE